MLNAECAGDALRPPRIAAATTALIKRQLTTRQVPSGRRHAVP
jgi:hypothetical protein